MMRRTLHRLFELGIIIKGIDGALELVGGLLLLFLSPDQISDIISFFIREELREDPADLVANLLLHSIQSVIRSRSFAGAFLLVHGVTKLLLVAGLATNQLWSYPVGIAVFGAFTVYQIYELVHRYSFFLVIVTVLDIIVIALIFEEYGRVRTENPDLGRRLAAGLKADDN